MASDDDMHDVCVEKRHCGLCLFRLEDDDLVAAVLDLDLGRLSPPFRFELGHTHQQESTGIALHMCCQSSCCGSKARVICLHVACRSVTLTPMSSDYLAAVEYDFNPSIQVELRRRNRIRWAVTGRLKQNFLGPMPQELCHLVAGYVMREMAAVALQERAKHAQPTVSTIDLSRHVYATYVDIEGVPYLQSLRNSPRQHDGRTRCIYKARQGHAVHAIHICYDHLGIRDILVDVSTHQITPPRHCRDVWWTELARGSRLSRITTKSDGLKLRRVVDSTDSMATSFSRLPGLGWPAPRLACKLVDLDTCDIAKGSLKNLRMSPLECNAPLTSGYSVAVHGFRIPRICAHPCGTTPSCYSDLDRISNWALWMYMPVDEDEHLSQVCAIRHPRNGLVALMFRTNQDRNVLFGPYLMQAELQLQFHLIYSTTNVPSRIYLNEWDPFEVDKSIRYVGVEMDTPEKDRAGDQRLEPAESPCPLPLLSTSPPPYTQYNEAWYYTSCVLDNVVEIACCVEGSLSHRPVIGVMVHYGNGSRACLGQYRPDWVLDKSAADASTMLRIGLAKTRRNLPYVAKIMTGNPVEPESDSLSWIEVPWHGRLEWWFSQRQCRLYHCD